MNSPVAAPKASQVPLKGARPAFPRKPGPLTPRGGFIRSCLLALTLALAAGVPQSRASQPTRKTAPPPKPALPPMRSLKVEPDSLKLDDGRDERRVLVWGETAAGQRFDVTDEAALTTESPEIEIEKTGYILPKKEGKAVVTVSFGALKTSFPVTVE